MDKRKVYIPTIKKKKHSPKTGILVADEGMGKGIRVHGSAGGSWLVHARAKRPHWLAGRTSQAYYASPSEEPAAILLFPVFAPVWWRGAGAAPAANSRRLSLLCVLPRVTLLDSYCLFSRFAFPVP